MFNRPHGLAIVAGPFLIFHELEAMEILFPVVCLHGEMLSR